MASRHTKPEPNSTWGRYRSFEGEWDISLELFGLLPPSVRSVLLSTLGRDGKPSPTESIDTQTQWLGTCSPKLKARAMILIADSLMPLTQPGMPSLDSN